MSLANLRANAVISPINMADLGMYWSAVNPTPGTGLATIAALATLTDITPFIQINAGVKNIAIDFLRLQCTAAGTGGTQLRFAQQVGAAKAAPTGGTQIIPKNVANVGTALSSIWAGPLAAAAGTPNLIDHSILRSSIPQVGDCYFLKFGSLDTSSPGIVTNVASPGVFNINMMPYIVPAGLTGQLHIWLPGQTVASSWEVALGFYES